MGTPEHSPDPSLVDSPGKIPSSDPFFILYSIELIQFASIFPSRLGTREIDGHESVRLGPAVVA